MATCESINENSSKPTDQSRKGATEGILYETMTLAVIAKNGYELSKLPDSEYHDFAIGRETDIGKDVKFDDVVFRYTDNDNTKNLIFVQIKHKLGEHKITSDALCAEASSAKGGSGGGMRRDFNLQKYFKSYLSVREELRTTASEEFRNGKIKYVVIFTNSGFDTEELMSKGFKLEEAPDDIQNLFTLNKSTKNCYQLSRISDNLRNLFSRSSDLHEVARELAQCAVWKEYRENKIMGIDTAPIKHYHAALEKRVIRKSEQVQGISSEKQTEVDTTQRRQHDVPLDRGLKQKKIQSENKSRKKKTKNELYCEARFRDDFLENDEPGSTKELRDAIFEAVRELDISKRAYDDKDLKTFLKGVKWKVVPNFGKTKHRKEINVPSEWTAVEEEDMREFLKCLVFAVNQPRVKELNDLFGSSLRDIFVDTNCASLLKDILDKLEKTPPELRENLEKELRIYKKRNFEETWISGEKIAKFLDEQQQQIKVPFFVITVTLMYESEVMQLGRFRQLGEMEVCLHRFLSNSTKILCVETPQTLLSSIKTLQFLKSNKDYTEERGRIYINMDILKNKESRNSVISAFDMDRFFLLVVECRQEVKKQKVVEFYKEIRALVNDERHRKIIFIVSEKNHALLFAEIKRDFQDKGMFLQEKDSIDLRHFAPLENPFIKEVIIFQEQEERLSLASLTGISSWDCYVDNLSQETSDQGVIDVKTLVKILHNDDMIVGSKPIGTSDLDGAYDDVFEEINVETLAKKLMPQEHDNKTNDTYVISGISGTSEEDKMDALIQYLTLPGNEMKLQNHSDGITNNKKILIADDAFKGEDFQILCHKYPEKRIFWITAKCENDGKKFYLHQIFNPDFYLERYFECVCIAKAFKEILIEENLSGVFIFYPVEYEQELCKSIGLNEFERENFEKNCGAGKIKIFSAMAEAQTAFREISEQNDTVHLLEIGSFRPQQLSLVIWCDSRGSVENVRKYIDNEQSSKFGFKEDDLIKRIKDRKAVIFADDPGMGKTTTLVKLCEKEYESSNSIIESHWVMAIKLRDNLKAVRDIELKKDGIDNVSVVNFLTNIDSNLNNSLAKFLLGISLDKSKHFSKPLLLAFDGFDEILDNDDRSRILLLLKFLRNETRAKVWITTRVHYQKEMEKELATFAVKFSPLDKNQKETYITRYLQHRLYLCLNEILFNQLFINCNEMHENKSILKYADFFLNKMELIFKGDISRFIGTPLQLFLMLEGSPKHVKEWAETHDVEIPTFSYVGSNVCEIYENFIGRKYNVYFYKLGLQQRSRQVSEKILFDQYHKEIAESKTLGEVLSNYSEEEKDVLLAVGIIKFKGKDLEFIHKTFEEFFAAKLFIDCIMKCPSRCSNTYKQEYLLKVILLKRDCRQIRNFMNLMLQNTNKLNIPDESLKQYGEITVRLLNETEKPLIGENGSPLHVAVREGNNEVARLLLSILRNHPDDLKKFLFTQDLNHTQPTNLLTQYERDFTVLHIACRRDDVELVRALLDAVSGISEDGLQEFLHLSGNEGNALAVAVANGHNVEIPKELLRRAKRKLDLVLEPRNSLCMACLQGKEEFVDVFIQEFNHNEESLKRLLLFEDEHGGNALYGSVEHSAIVEILVSAAKSLNDRNETLKNLLFPTTSHPFPEAVGERSIETVTKLINAAKDVDDDNHILKRLLLKGKYGGTALHSAAMTDPFADRDMVLQINIINLLLETAADLGVEVLEELLFFVDKKTGKNFVELLIEEGNDEISVDSFTILAEEKYRSVREKVMEMFEKVPWEWRRKCALHRAIRDDHIEKVKDILTEAKNSSVRSRESLRILLSAGDDQSDEGKPTFFIACHFSSSEVIKELLSCAINIDDGGATLKKMLGKYYLELVNQKRRNELIQIVENLSLEAKQNSKEGVADILRECWLHLIRENLFRAIQDTDIERVKDMLNGAESSSFSLHESIRVLLLAEDNLERNAFCIAYDEGNPQMIQELLSYAINIDDGGATLKEVLHQRYAYRLGLSIANELIQVFSNLYSEAVNNGKERIVDILGDYSLFLNLYRAMKSADISGIKSILCTAKGSSFLLYYRENILHDACRTENIEIVKEILFYAVNTDDGGTTLKEMLCDRPDRGTRDGLRNEMIQFLEILSCEAKNNNKEHVVDIVDEYLLDLNKENLLEAIIDGNVEGVKSVLSTAKSVSLLLKTHTFRGNALHEACERGNSKVIKEILSHAMNVDDGGQTLEELLRERDRMDSEPFQILTEELLLRMLRKQYHRHYDTLECEYTKEIEETLRGLISEAENKNKELLMNILEEIINTCK